MGKSREQTRAAFQKIRKLFQKRKISTGDQHDLFTRTIIAYDPAATHDKKEFKAILDAGCDAGDLVTSQVVLELGLWNKIDHCDTVIGVGLSGLELRSIGTIVLQWEGKGFYKIFKTQFHVMEGESLPWQIILGAATCAQHHLLTVGAFAGRHQVLPERSKEEQAEHAARKEKFKKEARANKVKVNGNKNKQVAGSRSSSSSTNSSGSSSPASP